MSEVKRYGSNSVFDDALGEFVRIEDYDAAQSELAALREELANAKRVGPPHFCGLPMSLNPHPEAGVPGRFLEVGTVSECIPCLVASRHGWAKTANDLQQSLTAADQRNAELEKGRDAAEDRTAELSAQLQLAVKYLLQSKAALNPTGDLAKSIGKFVTEYLKPTESGASE